MVKPVSGSRDKIVNKILGSIIKNLDGTDQNTQDKHTARDLLTAVASWGGKSKDEIVQVICREIGVATAAVLKEPLNQVLENRKLQITMELVPKTKKEIKSDPEKKLPVKKTNLRKKKSKVKK
tara:strand:+ start:196 stop:564 length:369 start_codon:yes stop_codon:yes gene_type:complete